MESALGSFHHVAQASVGITLAYYMYGLAGDAESGFHKALAYNAFIWSVLKASVSAMILVICGIIQTGLVGKLAFSVIPSFLIPRDIKNRAKEVLNGTAEDVLDPAWCDQLKNTGMRLNYVSTIIAGLSTLIFSAMCDKLETESQLWAMVLLLRVFDFFYNVTVVGEGTTAISGTQNIFAISFIATSMGVFIWGTGVPDATEEKPTSEIDRWFIGLSSTHILVLLLLLILKGRVMNFFKFLGLEEITDLSKYALRGKIEEGLTILVFSALYVLGSMSFQASGANKGVVLFSLLSLFHADIVSRSPFNGSGYISQEVKELKTKTLRSFLLYLD